jgi:hypothetical protein
MSEDWTQGFEYAQYSLYQTYTWDQEKLVLFKGRS